MQGGIGGRRIGEPAREQKDQGNLCKIQAHHQPHLDEMDCVVIGSQLHFLSTAPVHELEYLLLFKHCQQRTLRCPNIL